MARPGWWRGQGTRSEDSAGEVVGRGLLPRPSPLESSNPPAPSAIVNELHKPMGILIPAAMLDFVEPVAHQVSVWKLFPVGCLPGANQSMMNILGVNGMAHVLSPLEQTLYLVANWRN